MATGATRSGLFTGAMFRALYLASLDAFGAAFFDKVAQISERYSMKSKRLTFIARIAIQWFTLDWSASLFMFSQQTEPSKSFQGGFRRHHSRRSGLRGKGKWKFFFPCLQHRLNFSCELICPIKYFAAARAVLPGNCFDAELCTSEANLRKIGGISVSSNASVIRSWTNIKIPHRGGN